MNIKILSITFAFLSLILSYGAAAYSKVDVTTCPGVYKNSTTDSSSGLQTCIISAGSEAAVYFPPGYYTINSTITVANNNVTLYSDSRASAKVNFFGCGDAIKFTKGSSIIFNSAIRGLWINGDGHCVQTGVHVLDGSWVTIEDAQLSNFNNSTEESAGVLVQGREGFYLRNVDISANNPIVLGNNPNHSYLDVDHTHFQNIYTRIQGAGSIPHWHITLKDPNSEPVVVTNLLVDGQNPMTGGCGILSWIAPATLPVAASYHLKLSNIRHEQMSPLTSCTGHINIQLPSSKPLQQLIVENVRFEGSSTSPAYPVSDNAIYLISVDSISVRDTSYPNGTANSANPANFINSQGAKWIEYSNNYLNNAYASSILTNPILVNKAGPYRGKGCCLPGSVRTADSGILGQ